MTTAAPLGAGAANTPAPLAADASGGNPPPFLASGGSIVYQPSLASNLYWAPISGEHSLTGLQPTAFALQTLNVTGVNLMTTSANCQLAAAGAGLHPGTYTEVPLLGVTPGPGWPPAQATVVVSAVTEPNGSTVNQISSLTITRAGTYLDLPDYEGGPSILVLPDLASVNASGLPIASSADLADRTATPPKIVLTTSDQSAVL